MIRKLFVAAACLAVWSLATDDGLAQRNGQEYLFVQYNTQAGASTANAEMYPAPHPVPAHVGNSYYTYQPLMPHEMMYTHSREYFNYYAAPESFYCGGGHRPGYGFNKTTVCWQAGSNSVAPLPGAMFSCYKLQRLLHKHHNAGRQPGSGLCARIKGHLAAHCAKCSENGESGSYEGECDPGDCGSVGCDDSGWSDEGYDSSYEGCEGGCPDCAENGSESHQQAAARAASMTSNRYYR